MLISIITNLFWDVCDIVLNDFLIDDLGAGFLNPSVNLLAFNHPLVMFHMCATLKPGHFVPFVQDEKLLSYKKKHPRGRE